jgi:hypothetical protein
MRSDWACVQPVGQNRHIERQTRYQSMTRSRLDASPVRDRPRGVSAARRSLQGHRPAISECVPGALALGGVRQLVPEHQSDVDKGIPQSHFDVLYRRPGHVIDDGPYAPGERLIVSRETYQVDVCHMATSLPAPRLGSARRQPCARLGSPVNGDVLARTPRVGTRFNSWSPTRGPQD